ncbi:error-prone DNA polymerase [Actinobaculum massiliense]|uniref:Error-prone DNA polymerase n=1 Tax=Actinobaculum massiliense ACS-171-V-Col2 TaxID=883066 RepID=K9EDC8_9ACTO|nr:error-prone DNA polymerase [Actinobaculum massiliense]EKU94713.1 DNA polymerase III, alpha subunit [Actinobaculum massiliense ACS-171-V-Col2]MDK8319092.1 error-prone DNA polymerase [Actinobaculum massiliense]MDK8567224.1 error-prone DNA polymerase [Actinobaculum massiliense]
MARVRCLCLMFISYAELHAHSAFSFLDGGSLPQDMVDRAAHLDLEALALTDHEGFPGVVQLSEAAREVGLPVVIGTELSIGATEPRTGCADPDGTHLVLLARNADGYKFLSHAVGSAMLAAGKKGHAQYEWENLATKSGDVLALSGCRKGAVRRALEAQPGSWGVDAAVREAEKLRDAFGENAAIELTSTGSPLDSERCDALIAVAKRAKVEALVTGNAHYARPADRPVADVLAATRAGVSLDDLDPYLPASGSHLRSGEQMLALHPGRRRYIEAAAENGKQCSFDFSLIAPSLPPFPVPSGYTEETWLSALVQKSATQRYGTRSQAPEAWKVLDREMEIITQLGFPGYFLIIHEIVDFCAQRGIWCQGRGSAANSAVCYALGITAVDAVRHKMLFERFLSPGRSGPPDIDLDIESGRREEVIQHVYEQYGRRNAAQVANVISYRPRSAIRDAAKALGYSQGQADGWAKSVEHRVPSAGAASPADSYHARWDTHAVPADVSALAQRMQKLPRHLGIHSSGMVLCDRPVIDVCPVGWATTPGRTVLQWDKDDCAAAGLVKFDLLGLGMLTALRLGFTSINDRGVHAPNGKPLALHNLPQEDPRVYRLLQAADTIGVFQVESRAQMATLPRLRPECFYDIVIEVALIRPGPIQGGSVNPYIRRRRGEEPVTYTHELLKPALEKTLGVPLFQEQLMQIAIDAAGFSAADADQLRKAMGSKRSLEKMERLRGKLMLGMKERGIGAPQREAIYDKLRAFAQFGFPESHSFSFAYLVYASAWLKVHYPEDFYAGILAAQPMGFYSPQTLVADARAHGVRVLRPDVTRSEVKATVLDVETYPVGESEGSAPANAGAGSGSLHSLVDASPRRYVQLGLESIRGIGGAGERIVRARKDGGFADAADMARKARLSEKDLEALAAAGALRNLGMKRREGMWLAHALENADKSYGEWYQPALPGTEALGKTPAFAPMDAVENTIADISVTGISTEHYPTEFLREQLDIRGVLPIAKVGAVEEKTRVRVAGVVTHRQRPGTAKGITFLSLQDETGLLNVLVSPALWERHKKTARRAQGLIVRGMVEKDAGAIVFIADGMEELPLAVSLPSRDFR